MYEALSYRAVLVHKALSYQATSEWGLKPPLSYTLNTRGKTLLELYKASAAIIYCVRSPLRKPRNERITLDSSTEVYLVSYGLR